MSYEYDRKSEFTATARKAKRAVAKTPLYQISLTLYGYDRDRLENVAELLMGVTSHIPVCCSVALGDTKTTTVLR